MSSLASVFLRRTLLADAVTSGAMGLLLVLGASPLAGLLGLPRPLLFWAGVSLLPFAALVAYVGSREQMPRPGVWAVVVCNALWTLDSLLFLALGGVAPTVLGVAFVMAQALAVAVFAGAEFLGMRRAPAWA